MKSFTLVSWLLAAGSAMAFSPSPDRLTLVSRNMMGYQRMSDIVLTKRMESEPPSPSGSDGSSAFSSPDFWKEDIPIPGKSRHAETEVRAKHMARLAQERANAPPMRTVSFPSLSKTGNLDYLSSSVGSSTSPSTLHKSGGSGPIMPTKAKSQADLSTKQPQRSKEELEKDFAGSSWIRKEARIRSQGSLEHLASLTEAKKLGRPTGAAARAAAREARRLEALRLEKEPTPPLRLPKSMSVKSDMSQMSSPRTPSMSPVHGPTTPQRSAGSITRQGPHSPPPSGASTASPGPRSPPPSGAGTGSKPSSPRGKKG